MNVRGRLLFAFVALALASCSGNFAAGPSQPGGLNPPAPANGAPAIATSGPGAANVAKNLGTGDALYALADAANGFPCPVIGEYTCILRFNVPPATPAPPVGRKPAKASPTPSPSPSAQPTGMSPLPSPSASPAGDTIKLTLVPLPKDAPALVHVPAGALVTTALALVRIQPSADFVLHGDAIAAFTVPKEQIGSRGFVLQIFQESVRHRRREYRALYTFNRSSIDKNTLTFAFTTPKITVTKNSIYDLVLYAGDEPSASPVPGASPTAASGSPKPAVTASP